MNNLPTSYFITQKVTLLVASYTSTATIKTMSYELTGIYAIDYSASTAGLSAAGAAGGAEAGTGFKASSNLSIGTNGM